MDYILDWHFLTQVAEGERRREEKEAFRPASTELGSQVEARPHGPIHVPDVVNAERGTELVT